MLRDSLFCMSIIKFVLVPALAFSALDCAAASDTGTPPTAQETTQLPSPEIMVILIRSSVEALNQANVTNDYTVLNALGSANFRAANPPQRLAAVFQSFRTNHVDLSYIGFINPELTASPSITNGRLRLIGRFPLKPTQVNFDLSFEPDEGKWKLFGLGVNLAPFMPITSAAHISEPAPINYKAATQTGYIQLGSFGSATSAKQAWNELKSKFAFLEPMSELVSPANVNGTTVYRLRVATGNAAAETCTKLKAAGEKCLIEH